MTTDERKEKVADLRKRHEASFAALNIPDAYFVSKYPHVPEGMMDKHIGLYQSECSRGDDIYIECCDMNYKPLDERRMLYVWKHDSDYAKKYHVKKEQFMIPVSELHFVAYSNKTDIKSTEESPLKLTSTSTMEVHTYKGKTGASHSVTFSNGIAHNYRRMNKEGEPDLTLNSEEFQEMIELFKIINIKTDGTK